MEHYKTDLLDLRRMDCMDLMRDTPDKHFTLAIVDPPYGIGEDGGNEKTRLRATKTWTNPKAKEYKKGGWDKNIPNDEYFYELMRVSKNQIIFGANHFGRMPPSPCWIFWDKLTSGDFADGELAWTSFSSAVRKFTFLWSGFKKGEPEHRIHPTQKPVALYRWLLANYAHEGDNILDTHMGSGSIAVACHYAGYSLTACELDQDYFDAAIDRIDRETAQLTLAI